MARHRFPRALAALAAAAPFLLAFCTPALGGPIVRRLPHKFTVPEPFVVGKSYSFTFRFFGSADPGVTRPVWQETKGYTVPTQRLVTHDLGSVRPFTNEGTALPPVDFGVQLWVQVSSGTKLIGGRTRLAPIVPYALHSENVALGSVTSDAIADGAVTDADIASDAAIADGKLAQITSAGKVADSALSPNVVLTDNAQTLTALKTFNPAGGDVPFAVDSSKTGPVANLHVEGALNASAVGGKTLTDLDARYQLSPYIQLSEATAWFSLAEIGDALDAPAGSCSQVSITVGEDGLPVVTSRSQLGEGVLHCGNKSCTSANTFTLLHGGRWNTSIAIGSDGLPVLVWCAALGQSRIIHCGDALCVTSAAVDVSSTEHNSMTIGADGFPIVAFSHGNNLTLLHCGNSDCTSGNLQTVYPGGAEHASIIVGADGLPVISYSRPGATGGLEVRHCSDLPCSTSTAFLADSSRGAGDYSSIIIGTDRLPIVSYFDSTNRDLKVLHCGNASCSADNTITTVDSVGEVGFYSSIAINFDGRPVISYYDRTNADLKIVRCGNIACSSGNLISTIDAAGDVGACTSITIGADELPIISYIDSTNGRQKIAKMHLWRFGRR